MTASAGPMADPVASRAPADALRVRELHDWPAEASFNTAWQQLWERQSPVLPFTHPAWVRGWWQHLGARHRLVLVLVEQAGELLAVAPFYERRSLGSLAQLGIVGYGTTNDYNDWLVSPDPLERDACLAAICQHLARRENWLSLSINGVRPDSCISAALPMARAAGLVVQPRDGLPCPFTRVQGDWQSYLRARPRTLRYHLSSRLKRLAKLGPVSFRQATANTARTMLDEAVRLHRLRWARTPNNAIFSDGTNGPRFYRDVIPTLISQGVADITTLCVGDQAVASVVGFQAGGRYDYYIPAYDPFFNVYVPGKLIVAHLMERAFREHLEVFDFMLGDESYKSEWATEQMHVVNLTLAPDRWQSRALLGAERLARRVDRLVKGRGRQSAYGAHDSAFRNRMPNDRAPGPSDDAPQTGSALS